MMRDGFGSYVSVAAVARPGGFDAGVLSQDRRASGYRGAGEMKTVRLVLIVACLMSILNGIVNFRLLESHSVVVVNVDYNREDAGDQQYERDLMAKENAADRKAWITLSSYCALNLLIVGLLIFAILRLPKSN